MEEPLVTGDLLRDRIVLKERLKGVEDFVAERKIPDIDRAAIAFLEALLISRNNLLGDLPSFAASIYWLGRYAERISLEGSQE